jgi:single-strand DNA-binding protein
MNYVFLAGNIGAEPTSKMSKNDKKVVSFRLATTHGYGDNKKTEWHNVTVFDKTAEFVEKYGKKGASCCVVGRIETSEYTGSDGTKKYFTAIIGNDVKIFKSGSGDEPVHGDAPKDGLPF